MLQWGRAASYDTPFKVLVRSMYQGMGITIHLQLYFYIRLEILWPRCCCLHCSQSWRIHRRMTTSWAGHRPCCAGLYFPALCNPFATVSAKLPVTQMGLVRLLTQCGSCCLEFTKIALQIGPSVQVILIAIVIFIHETQISRIYLTAICKAVKLTQSIP